MENRENKVFAIAFIPILSLTTGCGITITKNHYYAYPDQNQKKLNKNDTLIGYPVDTLINNKYG